MPEVPEVKLILSLTVVFVIGTFVFIVIFRAMGMVQELQTTLNPFGAKVKDEVVDEGTIGLLQLVPWALGVLYLILVGVIGYFMYKKYKQAQEGNQPPILRS